MSPALLLMSLFAQADELSVSPAWLDVSSTSGATVTHMLNIGMTGRGARQVRVYTGDWTWQSGRSAFVPSGTTDRSAELMVDAATVWVDASETTSVPVHIQVPLAGEGATYGVVFVEEVIPDSGQDGALVTTSRIAVPVLVASGQAAVNVGGIELTHSDDGQLHIDVNLTNNGVSHAQTLFRGALRSADGVVTTFSGNESRYLMPSQSRVMRVEGPADLAPGRYDLLGTLVVNGTTSIPVSDTVVVHDTLDAVSLALP